MVNRVVREGGGDPQPTPSAVPSHPKPPGLAPPAAPQPSGPQAVPGKAPSGREGSPSNCQKCKGAGKFLYRDERGFEAMTVCDCSGGGALASTTKKKK